MDATNILYRLPTGNRYDYDNVQGNIGEAETASTAVDFLSNHVSNWLSSDTFNIGIRYRPRTDSSSNEFGIDISQQLFGDRILLELEGNYDTQDNSTGYYGNNAKNFTGDFYLTALLDQTGNLKAKVFSRTIDRFDENQGMQESGIGLYYTENFNNFGDIIRNIKERFTGERRRRRLAILEAEKQSKDDADTDSQTESNQ